MSASLEKEDETTSPRKKAKLTSSVHKLLVDWEDFVTGPATANVSNSKSATATLLYDMHSTLGEGIVYDEERQEIVWTDILGKKFHRLSLDDGCLQDYELPKMLGSLGLLTTDDNTYQGFYLFAWQDGFQLVNPDTITTASAMSEGEPVNPKGLPTRLNDGRCDPTGTRYICGGYYGEDDNNRMKVFCVQWNKDEKKLVHQPIIEDVSVTNSLSFSTDGKTMYFADSPTKTIFAYDYDLDAKDTKNLISNKRTVYKVELENAVPDGSCVDAEGYLWNATWWNGHQGSRVRRIDPATGQVVFEVNMPDSTSQVSCCCFGGKDLDILFITTAGEGRDKDKEPHAGGLYAIKLEGVKGRPEHRFQV